MSVRSRAVLFLLTITIVYAGIMIVFVYPSRGEMPEPMPWWSGPVLEFELAFTHEEINQLFGQRILDDPKPVVLTKMDRGNMVDFGFIICYTALYWYVGCAFWGPNKGKPLFHGVVYLIAGLDVLENIMLLNTTSKLRLGWLEQDPSLWFAPVVLGKWTLVGIVTAIAIYKVSRSYRHQLPPSCD